MKILLITIAMFLSLPGHADSLWEVTDLRRMIAYECSEGEIPPEVQEVECPDGTPETATCFAENPSGQIGTECVWVDTSDEEQVSFFDGTMFILQDVDTGQPLEMHVFADVETVDGEVYLYEYILPLDPENTNVRQIATDNSDAPTVFFVAYTPDKYKFNLDVGNGQTIYWNFWPQVAESEPEG